MFRVDFHVHTPLSTCYGNRQTTAEEIVAAAVAAKLDGIAVTDHNSAAGVEEIARVAEGRGLRVFPGVEISTSAGHVLGIFETGTEHWLLDRLLERVGVGNGNPGDAAVLACCGIESVMAAISGAGGAAIPAHIDRWPSGLLYADMPLKERAQILKSPNLAAVEITIPENRKAFSAGEFRGVDRKLACIQSSDAHLPSEIGRRTVGIAGERLDLQAIRLAFESEAGVVFPE